MNSTLGLRRLCLPLLLLPLLATGLDRNQDGLDDVWHAFYGLGDVSASRDSDSDGLTDYQESVAGTDPGSSVSLFDLGTPQPSPSSQNISWTGFQGKRYAVEASSNLVTWAEVATVAPVSNGMQMVQLPPGTGLRYLRVRVADVDSDGDLVSDWAERLTGFNPGLPQTNPGTPDQTALSNRLDSASTVVVEPITTNAFERGAFQAPSAGRIRLRRTGGLLPFNAVYSVSGSATPGAEVQETFSGQVAFGFGQDVVELPVTPIADTRVEVPRHLRLDLDTAPAYIRGPSTSVLVRVEDSLDARDRLLYGVFYPLAGVQTSASGYAAVLVDPSRTSARIIVNFSSTVAGQSSAHLRWSVNGDEVRSLPLGSFSGHVWPFPSTGVGALVSDQAILDELLAGRMHIAIQTGAHPQGELRADLQPAQGSVTFAAPPSPPAVETFTGTAASRDVMRFLAQATFGPTDALAQTVAARGLPGWIDDQINTNLTPRSILRPYAMAADNWMMHNNSISPSPIPALHPDNTRLYDAWWTTTLQARDQLRQRVAFALSQILVVSTGHSQLRKWHYGTLDYWDLLAKHAFGNLRDILRDASIHPAMANYLSMIKNEPYNPATGSSPDENYAREIMQLFSIGLVQLHPDGTLKLDPSTGLPLPTYNNRDITEMARVFTGWGYAKSQTGGVPNPVGWNNNGAISDNTDFYFQPYGPNFFAQAPYFHSLRMFDAHHDTGAKTLVGGVALPAGQTGEQDLDGAVDALFLHPSFPPFMAIRLIQRLVTSNPSPAYVHRVARVIENDGSGVRGNLAATIRAILLDYEARSQSILSQPGAGKKREPLLSFTALIRAFGGASSLGVAVQLGSFGYNGATLEPGATMMPFIYNREFSGQAPLSAPSVFNWWLPSYSPPGALADGGLLAPEFMIANEANSISLANLFALPFWLGNGQPLAAPAMPADAAINFPSAASVVQLSTAAARNALAAGGVDGLLDYLDLLLCQGALSPGSRTVIREAVNATVAVPNSSLSEERVRTAIYLILNSPDHVIQR